MHFAKILICTDLSAASHAAFELAAYEKKMEGTEIILLNVCRLVEPFSIESPEFWSPKLMEDYSEVYRDDAISKMKKLAGKYFHGQDVRCEVVITRMGQAEEICAFAEKEKCDLIVMGSRGHTVLGAVFLGSVVQRTLLLSKCPVMIVPPEEKASDAKNKKKQ